MALPEIQKRLEALLNDPQFDPLVASEIPQLIETLFREDPAFATEYATSLLNQFTPDAGIALSRSARLHGNYEDALSLSVVAVSKNTDTVLPSTTEVGIKKALQDLKNPKGWWFGQKTKNQLKALEVIAQAGAASLPYFDDIYAFRNTKGDIGLAIRKILVHLVPVLNPEKLETLIQTRDDNSLTDRLINTLAQVTLGRLRLEETQRAELPPPKKRLTRADVIKRILAGYKNFDGEDLRGVDLSYMAPLELSLKQSNLSGVNLSGTDLRKSQIDETTILTGAILKGARLTAGQLLALKQGGSRLGPNGFHDFKGVVLDGEDLSHVDLSNMDLREAQFFGTCFTGANFHNLRISPKDISMIALFGKRAEKWIHDFQGINLSGEKFSSQAVSSVNLKEANLEGAILNRDWLLSIIKDGFRLDAKGVHDLAGISLEGADLRNLDLSKVNLKDAILTNAVMDLKTIQSIIISGSRLGSDNLHDFTGVNLEDVDLRGVDLSKLNLKNASLKNVRLDIEALLTIMQSGTRLGADGLHDFVGVDLKELDLRSAGIDLTHVNLKNADLTGAKLAALQVQQLMNSKSRLRLRFHNFSGVDLTGEDLQSLPVHQMDLSEVKLATGQISFKSLLHHVLIKLNLAQSNPELDQQVEWAEFQYLSSLVSYKEGVLLFGIRPDISDRLQQNIDRLINLAILITRVMDQVEYGQFRKTIHSLYYADHQYIINIYLDLAKQGLRANGTKLNPADQKQMVAYLEEAARVDLQVYQGAANLGATPLFMNSALKRVLQWPFEKRELDLDDLSRLALKLRDFHDQSKSTFTETQKYQTMRLALYLSRCAFGLAAINNDEEINTAMQAKKIGVAIHVLYGSGFGDPSWIYVGNLLIQLAQKWDQTPLEKNRSNLHRFGVLALKMVEEVIDFYHAQFDSLLKKQGPGWGWDQKIISEFTRSVYRSTVLYQLASHLGSLKVKPGSTKTVTRVMEILSRGEPPKIPYQAYFFDKPKVHEFADDVRVVGGKGRGLVLLTRHADEVGYKVPRGFTLPAFRLSGDKLDGEKIKMIMDSLAELERQTGLSFEKGTLKVSVRSGAAVSMPGMMDTILNVGSIAGVLKAVEDVYNSWDTPRSKEFRKLNGIPARWGSAVNIVVMVPATSGAGVAASFSQDGKMSQPQIHYGKGKTGEQVVKGESVANDPLPPGCEDLLKKSITFWEHKLGHPVELEFTIDDGVLYLLQLRTAHLDYEDEVRWVASQVFNRLMTKEKGIEYLGGARTLTKAKRTTRLDLKGGEVVVAKNVRGSGIPYVGQIGFDKDDIAGIIQSGAQAVYVTNNPDAAESAEPAMQAGAAISSGGNVLSHLAGVAKTMRLPHISGVPMSMGEKKVTFEGADPVTLKKGDTVSLDPKNGRIFKGAIDVITTVSDVASLIDWLLTHETSSSNGSGSRGQGGGGNLNTGTEQLATLEAIEADDDMSVAPEILEAAPLAPNLLPFASMPLLTGAPVLPVMNFARF